MNTLGIQSKKDSTAYCHSILFRHSEVNSNRYGSVEYDLNKFSICYKWEQLKWGVNEHRFRNIIQVAWFNLKSKRAELKFCSAE